MPLTDKFGRAITDLRISITDRCNYKCVYCRTGNEGALYGELPFADYLRMARVLVALGITKIRLTGGEPLLRRGVVDFVRELAELRPPGLKPPSDGTSCGTAKAVPFYNPALSGTANAVPFQSGVPNGTTKVAPSRRAFQSDAPDGLDGGEPLDIAMTTNGHLLAGLAQPLKDAGLN